MILKVLQSDTKKWFYYDSIRLFKSKRAMYDNDEENVVGNQVVLLPKERNEGDTVLRCDANFEDGSCLEIVFSEEGYLLNNKGETIERLD